MLGVSMRLPEVVDVATPLRSYIQSNYSDAELQSVIPAISTTASLRDRIRASIISNASDSESTVQLFLQYYSHLLSLQQRFPFGNTPPPSSMLGLRAVKVPTVRVCFTWFDSFRHTQKVADHDVAFELNSVLFDTAALYSRRATSIKGQATAADDSPIKEACRLFQVSAGLFDHLQRTAGSTASSGLSVDLSSEGLQMLTKLMLAQAQACFFEKSTYAASPKLVAKLAMGVSEVFKDCTRLCGQGRMKALQGLPDVYAWESHCYYQMLCYAAAAHYWHSKGCLAEDKYGEEIAHLDRARLLLDTAAKAESALLKNLADNRVKLLQAVQTRIAGATKDNDTIYYASVPRPETVRDPEPVVTVKLIPFVLQDGGDPFAGLLSPLVKQQSEDFRVKLKEAVAKMEREAQESGDYSKATVSSLGLPAALEAEEGEQGVSDEVWGRVHEIQYKGGRDALDAQIERIDIAVREAKSAVQGIVEEIGREKAEDDAMRAQFGNRWNRRSSEQLTAQFQRDLDIIRKYLSEADKSNGKVRTELERTAGLLDSLKQSRQQIDARMPHNMQIAAQSSATKREASDHLHTLLDQLSALLDERSAVIQELQAAAAKHDIVSVINANIGKGKSVDVIYAEELGQYDSHRHRLAELTTRQDGLLADIKSSMAVYESSSKREVSASVQQRQSVLQELNDAIRVFDRLQSNVNEGAAFYQDLQAQRIQPLRQRVDDFVVARQMEKQMVLSQLTQDIASYREDQPPTRRSGSYGQYASPSGVGAPSVYPVNPNMYEAPEQPMYSFAPSPTSSSPRQSQSSPPSTNPFAEYAPNPALTYQPSPPNPAVQRFQPSPPQSQYQPLHPPPAQPSPPPMNANAGYPGQYTAHAPPPVASSAPEIACPACTYSNPITASECEICGTKLPLPSALAGRPVASAVPMPQRSLWGVFGSGSH